MKKIAHYLSLIKFSHSIFALPFAAIGFFVAVYNYKIMPTQHWNSKNVDNSLNWFFAQPEQTPLWIRSILVLLCMVFARSAAMAFNRYLDRDIDAKNPRTKKREIPSGIIKPTNALWFTIASSVLFVICTWFINMLCFYLSFVALAVILGYSYTKRFTPLCHLVLGLGLSLAPIGAYLAITGVFAELPIMFSVIVLFWVSGFDIMYALQDEAFDKANNLKSIPVLLGGEKALALSRIFHFIVATLLFFIGFAYSFGLIYWVGACLFVGLLMRQHAIVQYNDLSKINMAFFTLNGIGSIVYAIFTILDLIFYHPHHA